MGFEAWVSNGQWGGVFLQFGFWGHRDVVGLIDQNAVKQWAVGVLGAASHVHHDASVMQCSVANEFAYRK